MCVYIPILYNYNNNQLKRSHDSKGEERGKYGRIWKEEREERNVIIKIQSQNFKKQKTKNKEVQCWSRI